jgi:hypothetical protein
VNSPATVKLSSVMPKYYFHIQNGDNLEIDAEGIGFSTLESAVGDAELAAKEMLAELLTGQVLDGQCFEITDTNGVTVATVPFRSALKHD